MLANVVAPEARDSLDHRQDIDGELVSGGSLSLPSLGRGAGKIPAMKATSRDRRSSLATRLGQQLARQGRTAEAAAGSSSI